MKAKLPSLSFFAASFLALFGLSSARAQLVTYETISQWSGSVITLTAGASYAQTFSNVLQIESMTYKFASYNNTGPSATTFTGAFVEWNTNTNTAGAVIQSLGTITLPASNTWTTSTTFSLYDEETTIFTYELPITLNALTDASTTYALVLTANQARNSLGFALTNNNAFTFGYAVGYTGFDWGFSQLVVEPAPTPEASTIASIAALALVAGLVYLRMRQQRQSAVPVPAALA